MQLPTVPWMWSVLFILLFGAGPAGALSAQPVAPDSFRSALARVDTLRSQGRFRPALTQVDRLHRRSPNDVEVLWRRALVISDLGRRSDDEDSTVTLHRRALRVADAARAADSTNAWAHLVTALAAGRLTLHVGPSKRVRHSRTVKRHTDRTLALDSTLAPAYHLRGRWHRQVADLNFLVRALVRTFYGGLPDASLEQAVRDFEQATRLESTSYNHLELGKTYLAMGRDTAARTQLERALTRAGSPFEAEHKREARALLEELD
ncbi:MAG: hypothetical protein V5A22_02565 [Salinivenus sp.]